MFWSSYDKSLSAITYRAACNHTMTSYKIITNVTLWCTVLRTTGEDEGIPAFSHVFPNQRWWSSLFNVLVLQERIESWSLHELSQGSLPRTDHFPGYTHTHVHHKTLDNCHPPDRNHKEWNRFHIFFIVTRTNKDYIEAFVNSTTDGCGLMGRKSWVVGVVGDDVIVRPG